MFISIFMPSSVNPALSYTVVEECVGLQVLLSPPSMARWQRITDSVVQMHLGDTRCRKTVFNSLFSNPYLLGGGEKLLEEFMAAQLADVLSGKKCIKF